MRRSDREITNPAKIEDILNRCSCCRIGFHDKGTVYIVPLSFGYEKRGDIYTLYFHGAKEGRKVDLLRQSPSVGFELDTNYALNPADTACGYSARFQSIIGTGVAHLVTGTAEKKHGLSRIMAHYAQQPDWQFEDKMLDAVAVFKLTVTTLSCKEHL